MTSAGVGSVPLFTGRLVCRGSGPSLLPQDCMLGHNLLPVLRQKFFVGVQSLERGRLEDLCRDAAGRHVPGLSMPLPFRGTVPLGGVAWPGSCVVGFLLLLL